jgi:hypothetical protein
VLVCTEDLLDLHAIGDLLPRRRRLPRAVLLEQRDDVLASVLRVDRVDLQLRRSD